MYGPYVFSRELPHGRVLETNRSGGGLRALHRQERHKWAVHARTRWYEGPRSAGSATVLAATVRRIASRDGSLASRSGVSFTFAPQCSGRAFKM